MKQVWLADDTTSAGTFTSLKEWWDTIVNQRAKFGHFVNASKSWLIVKNGAQMQYAKQIFSETNIQFTTSGKCHLGTANASEDFRVQYSKDKIVKWQSEIKKKLAEFAKSKLQAVYAAYTHGQKHKFNYFMRTIAGMAELFEPLDRTISEKLLSTITGLPSISDDFSKMFALPTCDSGHSIPVLGKIADDEYQTSLRVTAPLAALMVLQSSGLSNFDEIRACRSTVSDKRRIREKGMLDTVERVLPLATSRAFKQVQGKGVSSWLAALPLEEHGFRVS